LVQIDSSIDKLNTDTQQWLIGLILSKLNCFRWWNWFWWSL